MEHTHIVVRKYFRMSDRRIDVWYAASRLCDYDLIQSRSEYIFGPAFLAVAVAALRSR